MLGGVSGPQNQSKRFGKREMSSFCQKHSADSYDLRPVVRIKKKNMMMTVCRGTPFACLPCGLRFAFRVFLVCIAQDCWVTVHCCTIIFHQQLIIRLNNSDMQESESECAALLLPNTFILLQWGTVLASLSMAAPLHRKPTSIGTSCDVVSVTHGVFLNVSQLHNYTLCHCLDTTV